MKGKEKTVFGGRSNQRFESNKFNSNGKTGVEDGQKLQVTCRFEASTIEKIEEIQEAHGMGFAQTVRRLIRTSLSQFRVEQQGGSIDR